MKFISETHENSHVVLTVEEINLIAEFYNKSKAEITPILENPQYPRAIRSALRDFLSGIECFWFLPSCIPNCHIPCYPSDVDWLKALLEKQ